MITQPGQEIAWGELHVGSRSSFEAAGYTEVSQPTIRRVVMRIDFWAGAPGALPGTNQRIPRCRLRVTVAA